MRQLADVLEVRVVRRGELRLAVDTDDVAVETMWTRCAMPNMGPAQKKQGGSQGEDENGDEDEGAGENGEGEGGGRIGTQRGSDDTQDDDDDDDETENENEDGNDESFDADMDERQRRDRSSEQGRRRDKKSKGKGKAKVIDMDKSFSVRLSVRAFLKFLSVHVVSSTTIACTFFPTEFIPYSPILTDAILVQAFASTIA